LGVSVTLVINFAYVCITIFKPPNKKMKATLTGRVEITTDEIKNQIMELALKNKTLVIEAVDKFLSTKMNVRPVRTQYSKDEKSGNIVNLVCDVEQKIGQPTKVGMDKRKRNQSEGWSRPNVGVGQWLKEIFKDAKDQGRQSVPFEEVYKMVKDEFPKMDKQRLSMYLHNTKQFPEIEYGGRYQDVRIK
jgi:hypothetical protein